MWRASLVLAMALSCGEAPEPEECLPYVIVARADLYPGVPIADEDVYAIEISPYDVPEDARAHLFHDPKDVVGRMPHERILTNELIRRERIADPVVTGFNALLPQGLVAYAFPADSRFLGPGASVDVAVTLERPEGRQTIPLFRDVEVVGAVGGIAIFALRPAQAEQLAHAERVGKVYVTLRNEPILRGTVPITNDKTLPGLDPGWL